jgi:hypothetical protein
MRAAAEAEEAEHHEAIVFFARGRGAGVEQSRQSRGDGDGSESELAR